MMYGFHDMNYYYLIGFALLLIAAVLVASDATKRGNNGVLWAFIVIIMPMMGLFIYLIYVAISDNNDKFVNTESRQNRGLPTSTVNKEFTQTSNSLSKNEGEIYCTSCGKLNRDDATFCKYCGSEII